MALKQEDHVIQVNLAYFYDILNKHSYCKKMKRQWIVGFDSKNKKSKKHNRLYLFCNYLLW